MKQQQKFTLGRIIIFGHRVDKLKSFYVENFGFSVTEETKDQWIVLNAGNVEIAIHKIGSGYEPKNGEQFRVESNTKLVFYINDNLEDFRQQLIDKGVAMKEIKSFEGVKSLFCDGEDPEGNMFQIEQRLSSKAGSEILK
ncbi:MAG: VOC family protein [Cyclobacteriaceae bacterium]|nr:VOC family protein [Cyclobacteriaceae bacterium]